MKIRIIGPVGSGKTQLAKQLSLRYNIPVTSVDDLNWKRSPQGDVHRTPEERATLLKLVLKQNDWIIEGVQYRYGQESFTDADVIYFKDISHLRNLYYLVKRYLKNRIIRGPQQYSHLRLFIKWEHNFRVKERVEIMTLLKPYTDKTIVLKK
ncbi:DNA topology modulation protein FlaR [Pediococcus ethanolidurans]|uniref:DNA topology modulation protein FlaR n=1 Tax=Pediococcus ethanolidurans TaxID=319653 RepID=UPI001C1E8E75|nr:DNA topology modulation protein FlaR [Pediococcus ethanolidurans]MBU7555375.1 DNA topology modulation protein FlaR [Pediococcus ethanolidurans]MBU7563593.1 DNA topology modulation protein FlaR [Pediococcus ethanolidurans]MCV3322044.1 DNA topology modulation protein FlaR [Pediococcus ethanolidurans]MCV3323483.1 DNA topology modulation protein FlaR [Pediococcus ethanolidurans]MCV3328279.1 DNA topology modulation protein FlaR [Pediococcus ethanolidurans]